MKKMWDPIGSVWSGWRGVDDYRICKGRGTEKER